MQVDSLTATIIENSSAIKKIMRGLKVFQILVSRFTKVIADYITWESLFDLDTSTSSDEEGSSYSEGVRMSVFPYNCNFRTVNLPDYEIAWLRIN